MAFHWQWQASVVREADDGGEGVGWLGRVIGAIRRGARAYGPLIAVLATSPAIFYFGIQPPSGDFSGLLSVDGPLPAAVRAVVGPEADSEQPPSARPSFGVKGIYVSAAAAGTPSFLADLVALTDRTELNALVIDVKGGMGGVAFASKDERLAPFITPGMELGDLPTFTSALKEHGLYLIARLAVFQDPALAEARPELAVRNAAGGIWRDRRGISWVDPASREVWDYNLAIARAALAGGFDEVQFDYVRFPTDGDLAGMRFPAWDGVASKEEVIAAFFDYLSGELRAKDGATISADLFGLVTWHHDTDLNIGQRLVRAARAFDHVSPMVYPSHYPAGFNGYANPALHPYDIVHDSLERAKAVTLPLEAEDEAALRHGTPRLPTAGMRPWLQDFDLGADYSAAMVRAQIQACDDAGCSGWLLWNAGNRYTEAALEPAESSTAPAFDEKT
jgi:hypothetical protein